MTAVPNSREVERVGWRGRWSWDGYVCVCVRVWGGGNYTN